MLVVKNPATFFLAFSLGRLSSEPCSMLQPVHPVRPFSGYRSLPQVQSRVDCASSLSVSARLVALVPSSCPPHRLFSISANASRAAAATCARVVEGRAWGGRHMMVTRLDVHAAGTSRRLPDSLSLRPPTTRMPPAASRPSGQRAMLTTADCLQTMVGLLWLTGRTVCCRWRIRCTTSHLAAEPWETKLRRRNTIRLTKPFQKAMHAM
jgi:hypothetical protein